MDRENGVASVDAAEVGLALAFPGGLRSYIEGLAGEAAPVEKAVAAAWAGMDSLRVVTAELNGSVARPRVIGLSRARQALVDGASAAERQGAAGSGGGEGAVGDGRPISPLGAAWGDGGSQAARGLGSVGGSGLSGSVAPVIVGVGERGEASDTNEWASGMPGDDVAAAPVIAAGGGDATPVDDAWTQRSVAPVKVLVVRGAGGGGGLDPGRNIPPPDDATEVMPTAVAPVGVGVRAQGAGMRADVASALRSREMLRGAVGNDDAAASGVPGAQEQYRAASRRTMAGIERAGGASDEGLSGEVMAPLPPGRSGGGDLVLGNIMLDGHPVGTWMGSRIARDAARPGAGTTAFDPRQAPAWTPSGAL
jgi:hypothetical protein